VHPPVADDLLDVPGAGDGLHLPLVRVPDVVGRFVVHDEQQPERSLDLGHHGGTPREVHPAGEAEIHLLHGQHRPSAVQGGAHAVRRGCGVAGDVVPGAEKVAGVLLQRDDVRPQRVDAGLQHRAAARPVGVVG
jgi:hypothetical protein